MILVPQRKPIWLPRRDQHARRRIARWKAMALWAKDGVLISDGTSLLDCDDCPCDECVANSCNHCCVEPPEELLLTVPAGTYTDNCTTGNCSAAEGQFTLSPFGFACEWRTHGVCGGFDVCGARVRYYAQVDGADLHVTGEFVFPGGIPGTCSAHYFVTWRGTMPLAPGSVLVDCSFSPAITCAYETEQHQGGGPALCEADEDDTVTVGAAP